MTSGTGADAAACRDHLGLDDLGLGDLDRAAWRGLVPLAGVFLVSGALLATAEWMAARGDTTWHFYVFWVAFFLVTVPVARRLIADRTSPTLRGVLVVALGVWSLAPILLRTGNHPLFFDEFSHFRMLQDLVRTGHPVSSAGLLQIGASFPGLELVTSGLFHLSGLTLWLSALVIAAVAHVALLTGVYVLVRDASRSTNSRKRSCSGPSAAGVAATSGSTPHSYSARSSSRRG